MFFFGITITIIKQKAMGRAEKVEILYSYKACSLNQVKTKKIRIKLDTAEDRRKLKTTFR